MNNSAYNAEINKIVFIQHLIIVLLLSRGIILSYPDLYELDNMTQVYSLGITLLLASLLVVKEMVNLIKSIVSILTTKLYFNDKIICGKVGLLKTISLETSLNKINDIMIIQNLGGKILNYSTIRIFTSSNKYDFKYIKNANEFKNRLQESINK